MFNKQWWSNNISSLWIKCELPNIWTYYYDPHLIYSSIHSFIHSFINPYPTINLNPKYTPHHMNTTNYHSHLIISYILTLNSRNGLFIHTPSQMLLEPSLDYLFKFINYQQTLISTPILDYPSEISAQS